MTTFKKSGGWEVTPTTGTNEAGEEHYTGDPSVSILTVTVPDPPPEPEGGTTGGGSGNSPGGTPGPSGGGGGAGGGTLKDWQDQLKKWQKYLDKKAKDMSEDAKKKAEDAKKKREAAEQAKKDAKAAKDAEKNGTGSKEDAKKKADEAAKKEKEAKDAEKKLREAAGGDPKAQGTTHALTITVTACDTAQSIAAKMKKAAKADGLKVDEEQTGGCTVEDVTDVDALRGPGVVISFHGDLEPFTETVGPVPGPGGQKDDGTKKMVGPGGTSGGTMRNLVEHDEIDWLYRLEVERGTPNDGVGDAALHVALLAADFDPRSIRVLRANWRFVQDERDRDVLDVLAERLRAQGVVALRDESGLTLVGDVGGNLIVGVTLRLWPIPGSPASTAHWRLLLPRRLDGTPVRSPDDVEAAPVRELVPVTVPRQPTVPTLVEMFEPEPQHAMMPTQPGLQTAHAQNPMVGARPDNVIATSVQMPLSPPDR